MHTLETIDLSAYRHTRKTLQIETGSTPKTIRTWIKKADITGEVIDNIEYFTDEQRALILSKQVKRKRDEVIEAELVEPGAIELHQSAGNAAVPLLRFELPETKIDLAMTDTTALTEQTAQLEQVAQQGATAITQALSARFNMGIAQIVAEQDNLLRGIQAQALNGAAQSLSQGENR